MLSTNVFVILLFLPWVQVSCAPVTLEFWLPSIQYTKTFWDGMLQAFNTEYPDINITINPNITWGNIVPSMEASYNQGEGPDIVWYGNTFAALWQAKKYLRPLSAYFTAWSRSARRVITLDYWPQVTFDYFIDGDWWGVPMISGTRTLYWRKDLVKQVIGEDRPPATWEELYDWAYRINTTLDGVWGFGALMGTLDSGHVAIPVVQSFGGTVLTADAKCNLNSPESKVGLQFWANFALNELSPGKGLNATNLLFEKIFRAGNLAFYANGPWIWWNLVPSPLTPDQVGMALIPSGPAGHFSFLAGEALGLPFSCKHPDEAWTFIQWVGEHSLGVSDAGISAIPSLVTEPYCPAEPLPQYTGGQWWTEPTLQQITGLKYAVPLQFPNPNNVSVAVLDLDDKGLVTFFDGLTRLGEDIDTLADELCKYIDERTAELLLVILPVWDSSSYEIAFTIVLSILIFLGCCGIVINIFHRRHILLTIASPAFCLIIWLGSIMGLVALFFFVYPATQGRCLAKYWLGFLSFSLIFAALIAKTWRVWRIVSAATQFKKEVISPAMTFGVVVLICFPVLLLLILWSAIDTLDAEWVQVENNSARQRQCTSDNYWIWQGILFGYTALVGAVGLLLAFLTRKVAIGLNESRGINLAILTSALIAVIVIPIVYGLEKTPSATLIIAVAGGAAAISLIWIILFWSKFYFIARKKTFDHSSLSVRSRTTSRTTTPTVSHS